MCQHVSNRLLKAVFVLSFCVLFLAHCHVVETKESSGEYTEQDVLAEFKIAKGGDPILLPVRFKGKEHLFALDTGSSHTVFDISFKHQLGKAKRIEKGFTAGGPMKAEFFDAPVAFLGPFNMQECGKVACIDLHMFSLMGGRKISGIVGLNFLRDYVVQIDFDKGSLLFLESTMGRPGLGEELASYYDSLGVLRIVADIGDGIKVGFIIDTGYMSTGAIDRRIFEKIVLDGRIRTSESLFETAAGTIRQREARIGNFSMGSFEYKDLILSESNRLCCLGLSFLSRHIVTFDFPNGKVYFKKGKEFNKVDETDMSGLHLLRISNKTVVHSVDEDSPAHKAGIRAKDIILGVENKDASEYDMWELRRLLMSGDKKKVAMTIKSGDDVKKISFLLKRKI